MFILSNRRKHFIWTIACVCHLCLCLYLFLFAPLLTWKQHMGQQQGVEDLQCRRVWPVVFVCLYLWLYFFCIRVCISVDKKATRGGWAAVQQWLTGCWLQQPLRPQTPHLNRLLPPLYFWGWICVFRFLCLCFCICVFVFWFCVFVFWIWGLKHFTSPQQTHASAVSYTLDFVRYVSIDSCICVMGFVYLCFCIWGPKLLTSP